MNFDIGVSHDIVWVSQLNVITLLFVIYKIIFNSLNSHSIWYSFCLQWGDLVFFSFCFIILCSPSPIIYTRNILSSIKANAFIRYNRPMCNLLTTVISFMVTVIKGFLVLVCYGFFFLFRTHFTTKARSITFYKKISAISSLVLAPLQNETYLFFFCKRIACNKLR